MNSIFWTTKLVRDGYLGERENGFLALLKLYWLCMGHGPLWPQRVASVRTSKACGASTDVRPHTSSITYLLSVFGPVFHVQYGDVDKPTSQGQCLLKENPVSVSFCTSLSYSLKCRPKDKPHSYSCHPLSPMSQKKRVQGNGQAKCNAMCCVVHGWPWSEQKGSLGQDYFMINLVVDSQSDWTSLVKTAHYKIGRNTAMKASWILGQSLWILRVTDAPTETELNLLGDDASPIWLTVLALVCGMVRDKRQS